jgi:hypothetical protein
LPSAFPNARGPLRLLPALAAAALLACAPHRALSPVSASVLAARLANDQCQKTYGKRPFAPDDFEARLDNGRWFWGTPDGGKVDGFEAEISFDRDGGARDVKVRIPEE